MRFLETAEIAKFSSEEADSYEDSLKSYRDYSNTIKSAYDEGRKERDFEIVKTALQKDFSVSVISELTGLSEEEILRIRDEIS